MNAERWRQIRSLFEQALALPVVERPAFLDHCCGSDGELRQDVEALLRADAEALDNPTRLDAAAPDLVQAFADHSQQAEADSRIGMRLGPWRLERHLGAGGMGSVYLAQRDDGAYRQLAAVKLVRADWDREILQQRFRVERQILAGLNHPNIARLLDGGLSEDCKPYLVLEYVDGKDIVEYCNQRRLDLGERLQLFLIVGAAVAHAHHRLVVHRDLKPSNILVDAGGRVKLLDFGIAKLLTADAEATAREQRLFTPEYAAPEQLRGEAITTGVDIYALGLLLFQLLTGRRPYGATGSTPAAYEQAILTQEPQRPSSAALVASDDAGELAGERGLDPQRLSRMLRGDLDAIVLKALRKDPEARFSSVEAMLEDVRRYLEHRPVHARRGDLRYRMGCFLRRHALAASLSSVALCSLLGGFGTALWQASIARHERDQARLAALKSESAFAFLKRVFELADPNETMGRQVTAVDLLRKGAADIQQQLQDQPGARIELLNALGGAYVGLGLAKDGQPLVEQALTQARTLGDPLLIGRTLSLLSVLYTRIGQSNDSIPLLKEALALPLPVDAAGNRLRGELEVQLGTRLAARSEYAEAEPWFIAGFQRLHEGGGMADLEAAIPYSSLLNSVGRLDESNGILRQAIAQAERELPSGHPLRASLSAQLATNYSRAGHHAEAIPLMRAALRDKLVVFGDNHPSVDTTRANLARTLVELGRWAEAEQAYAEVLPSLIRRNGENHPTVAAAQAGLARALLDSGRAAESLPLWQAAQRTAAAQFGELDSAVGITAVGMGRALRELGEPQQALVQFDLAVRVQQHIGPRDNKGMDLIGTERTRALLALGTPEPDCASARIALDHLQKTGVRQAYARVVLGECLRAIGQSQGAAEAIRVGTQQLRELQDESWPERRYAEELAASPG
ncbi:MAG: protein kinase [Lysobacterales bacterium]